MIDAQTVGALVRCAVKAYERLEATHYACNLSSGFCHAEQYGDGNAAEHREMLKMKQLIADGRDLKARLGA